LGKSYSKQLLEAKRLLDIPDRATLDEIKKRYRKMLHLYHPDKGNQPVEVCEEMTGKITVAYQLLLTYCKNYTFAFDESTLNECKSDEEWWYERFGKDPVWQKQD